MEQSPGAIICLWLPIPYHQKEPIQPRFPSVLSLFASTILLFYGPLSSFFSVLVSSQTYLPQSHYSDRVFKQTEASESFKQLYPLVFLIIKSDAKEMFPKITMY